MCERERVFTEERKQTASLWITLQQQWCKPISMPAAHLSLLSPTGSSSSSSSTSNSSGGSGNELDHTGMMALPKLVDVYCCNSRYRTACQLVFYERPASSTVPVASGPLDLVRPVVSVCVVSICHLHCGFVCECVLVA